MRGEECALDAPYQFTDKLYRAGLVICLLDAPHSRRLAALCRASNTRTARFNPQFFQLQLSWHSHCFRGKTGSGHVV